ncbi:RELT-like protein 2 [Brachyhypopomus gauderio]|uniref:RELT-like protein 2 n=1 Tax=Brachyhypopomus gauderio TaxID=698409 RepID=UPI0040429C4B
MTDQETSTVEEQHPPYIIFLLVFFFFITGLLGFIICHILKEKGYRCRTGEPEDEECKETFEPDSDDESDSNQDTVEQILKCIIENEANKEAFNEMLGKQNTCEQHGPRILRKESLGGVPPHLHTVHSGSDHNSCHHCMKSHSKKTQHRNRIVRSKGRPIEQTVFSVGRFRVTHMEKNGLQEPIHPTIPETEDQSDHTYTHKRIQESYNIRNMFKDVEATNGTGPNTANQKSITLLGFNKSCDVADPIESEVAFDNNNEPHIPSQLPVNLQKTFGSGNVPGTDAEVIWDKKSLNASSQNILDEVEVHKIKSFPDAKQVDEMSSDQSDTVEVQLVKVTLASQREFSVVRMQEPLTTTPASTGEN